MHQAFAHDPKCETVKHKAPAAASSLATQADLASRLGQRAGPAAAGGSRGLSAATRGAAARKIGSDATYLPHVQQAFGMRSMRSFAGSIPLAYIAQSIWTLSRLC
ncbi:unnamed protein product [Prorocentrum cordatum]|uniref:Uncharacterized protein n=1 Tax=Prorocentrum cordatum TaxID=2364126 RepID=A0ABN9V8J6_9DINO|nr:unnamed protein product [Polarella glacialis]